MNLPTLRDVCEAAKRIEPYVHRTPVATCATLDRLSGASLFFKCENLQKVGAFKARGASHAVLRLAEEQARRGVITHSSGNHGAALAYAARMRGIPCTVVIPEGAPSIKVEAVRGYGAAVVFCGRGERQATVDQLIAEGNGTFIHPFENVDVIAGQGTAALELLEQVADLDLVVAPVGGGGLLAGTLLSVRGTSPGTRVWGAEPEAVDDAWRSMESGELQPGVPDARSICDGLLTGLGRKPFEILRESEVRIVTVSEGQVAAAARSILERMKLVVEPSAATVLAAILRCADELRDTRIGAILSGGNTDFAWIGADRSQSR